MRKVKISFTGKTVLAVILALLLADSVLGFVLIRQNRATMRAATNARMLDVANTAAAMVDGDALKALTAEDANSNLYRRIYNQLRLFQDNIELEYIYAVNIEPDGTFTFNIDPSDSPGTFGSPVVSTPALIRASQGTPSVDDKPYTDAWGSFYSAYSPVYDSRGEIAGVIAVDFSAHWYRQLLAKSTVTVLLISSLSVLLGAGIAALVTRGLRRRFHALSGELSSLAKDMAGLTRDIERNARENTGVEPEDGAESVTEVAALSETATGDEIAALGEKIRGMQRELRDYLSYAREQAYIDALTGLGSKTAYLEMLRATQRHFDDGTAEFTLTVFDINDLKGVNDNYGHEVGDLVIQDVARAIVAAYGSDHIYRIGGDEFIAVRAHTGELDTAKWSAALTEELARVNTEHPDMPLSVSWGSAVYDRAVDADYRAVFKRADEEMYRRKNEYYRSHTGSRGAAHRA